MTLLELARHRREDRDRRDSLRQRSAIAGVAVELRGEAQALVRAGRPDLAEPYWDEAELFESASRAV